MPGTNSIARQKAAGYATSADFCRIFTKDMNRLYLLSFLLTADRTNAERCFVQGLDDSQKDSSVFREWAESWARRTIIAKAIRMIHPRPEHPSQERGAGAVAYSPDYVAKDATGRPGPLTIPEEIEAIVALGAFDRFAFVISVLEGYSDREASLLLNCAVAELVAARSRALQTIGGRAELHRKLAGIDAKDPSLAEAGAAYAQGITSPLVASA
jgi:hypothetical protein